MRRTVLLALALTIVAATASAQDAGPYVAGHLGVMAGDGGPALASGGSVGYMTSRRLGFELEVSASPDLDLGGPDRNGPIIAIYPPPVFHTDGRLLAFNTNVLAALNPTARLRVLATGGGGIASLRSDVSYSFQQMMFSPGLNAPGSPFPVEFSTVERRISRTETALSLNAGGVIEYALTRHLGIGVDARYTHVFFEREGMHIGRVAARARWSF